MKTLAYAAALALVFGAACGSSNEDNNGNNASTTTVTILTSNNTATTPANNTTPPVNNTTTPVNNTTTTTPPGNMTTPPANNTTTTTPANTSTPATAREKLSALSAISAQAICHGVYQCPEENIFLNRKYGRSATQADCVAQTLAELDGDSDFERRAQAMEAGRQVIDDEELAACQARVEAYLADPDPCAVHEVLSSSFRGCQDVLAGAIPPDEPCLDSEECTGGRICRKLTSSSARCERTCQYSSLSEENCGDKGACGADEYCSFDTKSCQPLSAEGQACSSDSACRDATKPMICSYSSELDASVCTQYGNTDAGGACDSELACKPGLTCAESVCSVVETSVVGMGEPCNDSENTPRCEPGLVCQGYDFFAPPYEGTCGAPKEAGSACHVSEECAAGLICSGLHPFFSGSPGECAQRSANGADCYDSSQCQSGYCDSEKCAELEACTLP